MRERGWAHPAAALNVVGSWRRPPSPRVLALVAAATVVLVGAVVTASVIGSPGRSAAVYTLAVYAGDGQSGHANGPGAAETERPPAPCSSR